MLDFAFGLYRIQPTEGADYTAANPRPAEETGVLDRVEEGLKPDLTRALAGHDHVAKVAGVDHVEHHFRGGSQPGSELRPPGVPCRSGSFPLVACCRLVLGSVEDIVDRNEGYNIVKKQGVGQDVARQTDPRTRTSG